MTPNIERRTVMKATGLAALLGTSVGSVSAEPTEGSSPGEEEIRQCPGRAGRFKVQMEGQTIGGVRRVDLPAISFEEGTYREGNEAPQEKKVAGKPTYDDLEMERGCKVGDTVVWDWVNNIRHGKVDGSRREIAVVVMDTEGNAQTRWVFTECWLSNYEPPDLDASADADVATESLTVKFDEMIRAEAETD